ncbi:cystathionine beta-lyase [bacterium]|nr:cystathionine beta-lyase [bacterium]
MSDYSSQTQCVRLGRAPEKHHGAVNIPPYYQSTRMFPTLEALETARFGDADNPPYGTCGTPTTLALRHALAELEGAKHAWLSPSGLTAVTAAILAVVKSGDHILIPDTSYGPTRHFAKDALARFGVTADVYDPMLGADIARVMKPNTRLVVVESPGSITMEVQDIPAIAAVAHKAGALVLADSTWAAPLLWKPFDLGVDISAWAATKYAGGHADVLMGVVSARDDAVLEQISNQHAEMGLCSNGQDAYLVLRGLRTLHVRMKQHEKAALEMATWLQTLPQVERVLHPALPSCPGHEVWKRDFSGSNGLFSILIKDAPKAAIANMLDNMKLFGMGYSWGGFESLILPFKPKTLRTASDWQHDGWLIRLHIGLDNVDDLKQDLLEGFERLEKTVGAGVIPA